jgi:hypothetical protein
MQIQLGDGTNRIGFHLAGSDVAAFRHDDGPTVWQCLVLDTALLSSYSRTVFAGSFVNLNTSAITQVGIAFITNVGAQGNVPNTYWDILRRGTPGQGLIVRGGTALLPGIFDEIATEDRSTANLKAHGIIRRLGAGLYGLQGSIQFGDDTANAAYFFDKNTTVVFEDRDLDSDKYQFRVVGGSSTNYFQLGEPIGSGDELSGTNGCSIICPVGVDAAFEAFNESLDDFRIYGSTLSGFTRGITLCEEPLVGDNHVFAGNTVSRCGQIVPGLVNIRNCSFSNFVSDDYTNQAQIIWTTDTDIRKCDFISGGNGNAIKFDAAGTYNFVGLNFSGYSGTGTAAAVHNNSGGHVTINVTGGGNVPSVRNSGTSTTTVVSAVLITLTGLKTNTEVRVYQDNAGQNGTELAGIENSGTSFSFSVNASQVINIIIFNVGYLPADIWGINSGTVDREIPIQQVFDRNFENP